MRVPLPLLPAARQMDVQAATRDRFKRQPVALSLAEDVCGIFGPVSDWVRFPPPLPSSLCHSPSSCPSVLCCVIRHPDAMH